MRTPLPLRLYGTGQSAKTCDFILLVSTVSREITASQFMRLTWPEDRFLPATGNRPMVSLGSAISCGTVRTFEFVPEHVGDHAYHSGVLKWAVPQGMWGVLRVE